MGRRIGSRGSWAIFGLSVIFCYYVFSWGSKTREYHTTTYTPIENDRELNLRPVDAYDPSPPAPRPAPDPVRRPAPDPALKSASAPAPESASDPASVTQSAHVATTSEIRVSSPTRTTPLQAKLANQVPDVWRPGVVEYDWKETEEELMCRHDHPTSHGKAPIPRTVHFLFLSHPGSKSSLEFRHFLAIKAAKLRIKPDNIKIHTYDFDRNNEYWKQLEGHVEVIVHDRNALSGPNNHAMSQIDLPHQSDILRIDILLREGGIYLDTDVYALKSFDHLLRSPRDILLGHEGGDRKALCNAVILARPDSEFLHRWQDEYVTFDPKYWNFHSVIIPKWLQGEYPHLICPLAPHIFFWPTYRPQHSEYMHELLDAAGKGELLQNMTANGGTMYPNQLANHAWGVMTPDLKNLTAKVILEKDTRFNILLRDIVKAEL